MIALTARQKECLSFIRTYDATNGQMPTLREIAYGINCHDASGAKKILDGLERRGAIRRVRRGHRAIEIMRPDIPVIINGEIGMMLADYAAAQRIAIDTAANELLRQALGADR